MQMIDGKIVAIILISVIAVVGFLIFQTMERALAVFEKEPLIISQDIPLTEEQELAMALAILEKNPQHLQSHITVAQIKYSAGDLETAKEYYSRALEIKPDEVLVLNNLADIYNQLKEYQKSAKLYLKLIEVSPKWVNSYRNLADIYRYHLKEKYPEMEAILLQGLEKSKEFGGSGFIDFYSMLALYYDERGEIEKAIEYYQKLIELDPSNNAAQRELDRLLNL